MSVTLSLIESGVQWIRAVGSPTCRPSVIGQISLALLITRDTQVPLCPPHRVHDEHDRLALMTSFAKLVHC